MGTTKGFSFREVLKNMGARSVIVSLLVFVLTVTLTCVVGYQFYDTTKENIQLQGKVNAVHAAKEFDGYLLVRKNTVILAGHVVDEMMGEGKTNAEILDYLSAESLSIKKSIDKDYTGLYGWINGEIRKLARPDAAAIPIIALSANAFEEDVKQCLEAGMNEHLSKPIDVDRLKETLGRLLG